MQNISLLAVIHHVDFISTGDHVAVYMNKSTNTLETSSMTLAHNLFIKRSHIGHL